MNRLFLMATGQSINDIEEQSWERLKKEKTIGISWFFKKNFETNYYYSHEFDTQSEEIAKYIIKNGWKTELHLGTKEEHNPKFFVENTGPQKTFNTFKNKIICKQYKFSNFLTSFNGHKWLKSSKCPPIPINECWAKTENETLLGFRGTLISSLNLCSVLGYKEIILCGVDLNNGLHFYDSELSPFEKYTLKNYNPKTSPHSTQIVHENNCGVLDCLKEITKNRLLNIKTSSKKSLLYTEGFEYFDLGKTYD